MESLPRSDCAPRSSHRRCSRWFQRPKAENGSQRAEVRGRKSEVGGARNLFRFVARPRLGLEHVLTLPNIRTLKRNKFRAPLSAAALRPGTGRAPARKSWGQIQQSNQSFFHSFEFVRRQHAKPGIKP